MGKIPMIIPVTDLRQDAAAALEKAREAGEPIVITQRGRAAAVMLSVEAYERVEAEREILISLLRGELQSSIGSEADPASVHAEIDRLLDELRTTRLTPAQEAELRRRIAAYRTNPDQGSSWEDVKARLLSEQ